jgi:methylated-DNA-[protein]-cysteine S-methyltransferase
MTEFENKVYAKLTFVPKGKVITYKALAVSMGFANASRAVGNALGKNPSPVKVPCHRVVKSNGEVGNYVFGQKKKIKLLKKEGVNIINNKVDLSKYLFEF